MAFSLFAGPDGETYCRLESTAFFTVVERARRARPAAIDRDPATRGPNMNDWQRGFLQKLETAKKHPKNETVQDVIQAAIDAVTASD